MICDNQTSFPGLLRHILQRKLLDFSSPEIQHEIPTSQYRRVSSPQKGWGAIAARILILWCRGERGRKSDGLQGWSLKVLPSLFLSGPFVAFKPWPAWPLLKALQLITVILNPGSTVLAKESWPYKQDDLTRGQWPFRSAGKRAMMSIAGAFWPQ